jgi:hypothetical protein
MSEALSTNERTITSVAPQERAAELVTKAAVKVTDNAEQYATPIVPQPRHGYYDSNLHGNDDWANLA